MSRTLSAPNVHVKAEGWDELNIFSFLFLVSPLGDCRQPTRHLLRVVNNIHTIHAAVDGSETRGTPTPILYIRVKLASSHADNHLFHLTMP